MTRDVKVIATTIVLAVLLVAGVFTARAYAWSSATASVFDAQSEPALACRDYPGLGVAHKSLPCGARVKFCFRRCAWARVEDRGPYVAGRSWDLDDELAAAIGFPYGVGIVRWRRAR